MKVNSERTGIIAYIVKPRTRKIEKSFCCTICNTTKVEACFDVQRLVIWTKNGHMSRDAKCLVVKRRSSERKSNEEVS